MRRRTLARQDSAAKPVTAVMLVLPLLLGTVILLDNLSGIGTALGDKVPDFEASARAPGGTWQSFSFYDHMSEHEGKWVVLEFGSTDCSACWSWGKPLTASHQKHADQVEFLAIYHTWNAQQGEDSSVADEQREVAAFQDAASAPTLCRYGQVDCAERPGGPHDFTYLFDDDRDLIRDWGFGGTPSFVILDPDLRVVWTSAEADGERVDRALDRLVV